MSEDEGRDYIELSVLLLDLRKSFKEGNEDFYESIKDMDNEEWHVFVEAAGELLKRLTPAIFAKSDEDAMMIAVSVLSTIDEDLLEKL